MRAFVRLRAPDGSLHELVAGDVVGRLRSAALPLEDGRVSEAHAMVSLREQELRLIALRGLFAVDGVTAREVTLEPGLRIELARGLFLTVEDVALPDAVLGLEGSGLPRQALPPVASLRLHPEPHLAQGHHDDADAWIWSDGDGFVARVGERVPAPLRPGDALRVGGLAFQAVPVPLALAGLAPTRRAGRVDAALHLIVQYDTVHVRRAAEDPVVLSGILARTVSELVAVGGPIGWQALAAELWPEEDEPTLLRSRLDVTLSRLRRRLRESRVRSDLVATDGAGKVELLLHAGDVVEDRQ